MKTITIEIATHLLFGLILNQGVKSSTAWRAPKELKKRLGLKELIADNVLQIGYEKLYSAFVISPCLHRFPETMVNYLFETCITISKEFGNDPRNIWRVKNNDEIINNFRLLPGIGSHKSILGLVVLSFLDDEIELNHKYIQYVNEKCSGLLMTIHDVINILLGYT